MPATDVPHRKPNRLIHEKSPYLLQHAYNPVDWYPWGSDAFAKAKAEDKPIFLSIGYSTCHWCHVMEHESFENPDVAKVMNASVVAIKVDREERPDIDAVYMQAVMAVAGQGGWPLSVFLTPEGKPFWGGTYFPPTDQYGRPGFARIVQSIAEAWKTKRDQLLASSQELTQALQQTAEPRGAAGELTTQTLALAVRQFTQQYDAREGGFGGAPKFPRSHALSFLLSQWSRTNDAKTLAMVEQTLDHMARGGMYDHVGGGFHRYSTDDHWLVPHFEKMLYDQALLARTYLEAHQATGKTVYAGVARDIFTYVLRDMTDAGGGFYAAEDADSEGREGKCYVWTPAEIETVLGKEEAGAFSRCYGVTASGNFEGENILHLTQPVAELAAALATTPEALAKRLAEDRAKLLAVRNRRVRPHRDDKILTDWNGLMIGALAYGARALNEPQYAQAAERAATFLLERVQQDGRLLHRYRDGEAAVPAYLDDYAFLSWGLLDLYEATFNPRWLSEADRLTREMVRLFWDGPQGGFFLSGEQNEALIARTKELYDGALPSGNSVAALCLVRLNQLTADQALGKKAEQFFRSVAGQLGATPHAFPQCAIALDWWLGPQREVVIAGDPQAAETRRMIELVNRHFLPRTATILHPTQESAAQSIEALTPFIKEQQPMQGKTAAFVCQNHVCLLPTTDPAKLTKLLEKP